MPKVKAYLVRVDDSEGGAAIAFATNNASARRKGGNELDASFEEVESCRRAPEFDAYAPGPVPPLVLIEHGWWFECFNCGRTVREDEEEDDDGDPLSPVAVGQAVFCCPICQARHYAEQRARKAAEAAFVEIVVTKWPEAKVHRVSVYGDRLEPSDNRGGIKCAAYFELPGLHHDVQMTFGDDHVMVAQMDVEAFKARYGVRETA
jgi:hypothetical protein